MGTNHILVIAYARPDKLSKVLGAIELFCDLSDYSITIALDYHADDKIRHHVYEIAKKFERQSSLNVEIKQRTIRLGLKNNILQSLDEVISNVKGQVLILEEDCILQKPLCDQALYVSDTEGPYHINLHASFQKWMSCWGWSAQTHSIRNFLIWQKKQNTFTLFFCACRATLLGGMDIDRWKQVLINITGRRQTWAIYYHIFCIIKKVKVINRNGYILNIGFDGSGESK